MMTNPLLEQFEKIIKERHEECNESEWLKWHDYYTGVKLKLESLIADGEKWRKTKRYYKNNLLIVKEKQGLYRDKRRAELAEAKRNMK